MSIRRSLPHYGPLQVQISHEAPGPQIEIRLHKVGQISLLLPILLRTCPIRVDIHRNGMGHPNRIGNLHATTMTIPIRHERLGNPPRRVRPAPVDFGGILSAQCPPAIRSPAPVGIHHGLSSRQAGIGVRTSDDKPPRRIEMINRPLISQMGRNHRSHYVLQQVRSDLLVADFLRMLRRNDHRIHPLRHRSLLPILILQSQQDLPIGSYPIHRPVLPHRRQPRAQPRRQHVTQRHILRRLRASIPKHHRSIPRPHLLRLRPIHALRDVRTLLLQRHDNVAGLVIQPLRRVVVAGVADGVAYDLLVVDGGGRGDFAEEEDHAGFGDGFAGDAGGWVEGEAGVEDGVGDGVA
mmetsp:Transcript_22011/g.46323  ORF Transcript_22011/g.46323 Transcript_22011/m.46323 type:complete len:350 (+) Transcript_22011:269-1318(+)